MITIIMRCYLINIISIISFFSRRKFLLEMYVLMKRTKTATYMENKKNYFRGTYFFGMCFLPSQSPSKETDNIGLMAYKRLPVSHI